MVPAGTSRETDFGREVPAFEVDAMAVEPVFHRLYSYIFDMESGRYSGEEMDRPVPSAIFIVNFDKVRVDPRKKDIDLESLMYGRISQLTEEEMKKQEGDYVYRYRYNGGGASQVWLSSGRFVVIDLSAGPCTYGKIETEEGNVSSKTLPRLRNVMFPRGLSVASDHSAHDIFVGQVAALVATTIEHVIAPDVRSSHPFFDSVNGPPPDLLTVIPANVQPFQGQDVLIHESMLGISKHAFLEQGAFLHNDSKHLAVSHDHFKAQSLKSSMDQLHKELERMKNDNSLLLPLDDHYFDPNFQGLQTELMQLHKVNEELRNIFPVFNELGSGNAL